MINSSPHVVNMRTDTDCGIAAVATVTGQTYETVRDLWPGGFKGNSSDSYIHHQKVIERLGLGWRRITFAGILSGDGAPDKTAMLLNAQDDPATWAREDWTMLHWCVLAGRTPNGIYVHWLNGRQKAFSFDDLRKHMTNPCAVAYQVIDEPADRLPWYKRLYTRVISWLPGWLRW